MRTRRQRRGGVILLDDLAPRQEIKGGAGKRVFGESVVERPTEAESRRTGKRGATKTKD
jgi:hypothetical protein